MKPHFLWTEKYRPVKVADAILPERLRSVFQEFADKKNVPNLLLVGKPGIGKTATARALLDEIGADVMIINGSLDRGIDVIRDRVSNFASSMSFTGGRKYVIFDEADGLTQETQQSLRNFMDTTAANCGFILTANFKKKVIEPLWSRCSVVEFDLSKDEKAKVALQFHNRLKMILDKEGTKYDAAALPPIVMKYIPDFRRCINEVQRYSATGAVDKGLLTSLKEASVSEALKFMKDKNFTALRKWCAEHSDMDYNETFTALYKSADLFAPNTIPSLVIILGDYQEKHAFVANPEINMAACMAQIMLECEFK